MTPPRPSWPVVLGAGALALAACGSTPAGSAGGAPTTSATTSASAPAFTDATACATFGERGVESRLGEVYADDAASASLVREYAGAPAFQQALRQTVDLLRSSGGQLEGDFLATACADQPTG
ncbi:hypothetical protein ACUN7V_09790 [Quadrisphaera oryzae]|uniref:hypothetical protein n=1 Tax=Quadrisphaera TaxID=317661 RepID=UPI0016468337|nr:hypothetical protein [Quadrisphaera sp. RL12-1S]MBC3760718.1 hypothetical protein [Quadrisphaera sp. RL12-1S]